MTKLERAKKIIEENIDDARLGIFDCANCSGDSTVRLNNDADFIVKICYDYEYFEVFGLSASDFEKLEKYYYASLIRRAELRYKKKSSPSVKTKKNEVGMKYEN